MNDCILQYFNTGSGEISKNYEVKKSYLIWILGKPIIFKKKKLTAKISKHAV